MKNFEPFYMVLCKLSIVNVWQKCQHVRLKVDLTRKIFLTAGASYG